MSSNLMGDFSWPNDRVIGRTRRQPRASTSSPERQLQRLRAVLDAVSLKRRHPELSMTEAAKRSGTTLRTIRRYARSAIEMRSGRLDARRTDRIPRDLLMFDNKGQITIRVTNSRDATRVAKYNNAVRRFLLHGDDSQLKRFAGKKLSVGGKRYPFVTDPASLNRIARGGEIHFLDIYSASGAAA